MKNKKELLKSKVRAWNETGALYDWILLVPAGTKHDSGFMHIAIIGVTLGEDHKPKDYEICGFPDDISLFADSIKIKNKTDSFEFASVRMDCFYPQGILRYHGQGKFHVSTALSSQDIRFIPGLK